MEFAAGVVLRPGLRVLRRDDRHLQVGLGELAVKIADTPGVRRLLRDLEQGVVLGPVTPEAGLALQRLADAGHVIDRADLGAAHALIPSRAGVAAAFAAHGPPALKRLRSRTGRRVVLLAPEPWHALAHDWLRAAGLAVSGPGDGPRAQDPDPAAPTLIVSMGEPSRHELDLLVRDDRDHLILSLLPDRVAVGPLVRPGSTACLRCVDAHLGEEDPRRSLLLEQLGPGSLRTPQSDPFDPVLAHAGLALAVRDVIAHSEGDRPATWSTTLTIDTSLSVERRLWARHPHCGCCWG